MKALFTSSWLVLLIFFFTLNGLAVASQQGLDISQLINDLLSPTDQISRSAEYQLIEMGEEVIPILETVLNDCETNSNVLRGLVTRLLGKIGNQKAIPILLDVVAVEGDPFVKVGALTSLGKIGNHNADVVEVVRTALFDSNDEVKVAAADVLGNFSNLPRDVAIDLLLLSGSANLQFAWNCQRAAMKVSPGITSLTDETVHQLIERMAILKWQDLAITVLARDSSKSLEQILPLIFDSQARTGLRVPALKVLKKVGIRNVSTLKRLITLVFDQWEHILIRTTAMDVLQNADVTQFPEMVEKIQQAKLANPLANYINNNRIAILVENFSAYDRQNVCVQALVGFPVEYQITEDMCLTVYDHSGEPLYSQLQPLTFWDPAAKYVKTGLITFYPDLQALEPNVYMVDLDPVDAELNKPAVFNSPEQIRVSILAQGLNLVSQAASGSDQGWVTQLIVAKDGTGDYTTIQAAINAIPDFNNDTVVLYIKEGLYHEKILIPKNKNRISCIGENKETTVLDFNETPTIQHSPDSIFSTWGSASTIVLSDDFTAENITFSNSALYGTGQALALRLEGDRMIFTNCKFISHQDTLFANGDGRQYFNNCYIEGDVDFIYGSATAVFEDCDIVNVRKTGGYITAASTPEDREFGFVFIDSRIIGDVNSGSVWLGRPWRPYSHTAYINCYLSEVVQPTGWHNWGKASNEATARYLEYNNYGPGANPGRRVKWSRQLSDEEAQAYTVENILKGYDGWNPNINNEYQEMISRRLSDLDTGYKANEDLLLWYVRPASQWEEALPIGNGRMGAMIFGDPIKEHLQLNEDTIWTGKPHDYSHKGAYEYLDTIRELIAAGKQKQAETLAMEKFMSVPLRQKAYQPFCDLYLDFQGFNNEDIESYKRQLDLEQAISSVSFEHQGVKYRREYLASYPHQGIFVHCDADQDGMISFDARLTSLHKNVTVTADEHGIILSGKVEPGGVRFEARLAVITDKGVLSVESELGTVNIKVREADSATIIFVGASSFINYKDISGDPGSRCEQYLADLVNIDYKQVKQEHIRDYQKLFSTVSLSFGSSVGDCPTDERIGRFAEGADPQLTALYFQYGRYLMISGSRPGSIALNLQGIWNDKLNPSWDSKFTCNINLPMNYWPTEPANLSICHQPLFQLIRVISETGKIVAQEHYNCRGWVLHHNTDIWGGSAPINNSNHGIWPTGGAWLCNHLWQHYLYTEDRDFLDEYYPIMRDAALFFVDFLVEDQKTGWLISTPSNSPEQGGLVAGPTMDHQIIRDLLQNCINASRILGVDSELQSVWQDIIERIAPNQIGKYGQLQEWLVDIDDPSNKHRHVSHLWGLHPGTEISPLIDPTFSEAVRKSLEFRGDKGTGWSMAWKINLWARLEEGDRAYKLFTDLITQGTYPNLFDAHPPFQIDGNFGGAAGIIEMLLQSHLDHISILPALPSKLPQGEVKGLCAVGGFTVDISWSNGKLVAAEITSKLGNECRVRYGEAIEVYNSSNQLVQIRKLSKDIYAFDTEKDQTYRLYCN